MPSHACQRCGKEFARKTGVTAHMKRKNPCKPPTALVQKQVNEVLVKVAPHLEVPVAEFRDVSKKFHETLSKDQRQEEGIFFTPKKVREVLFEALNALKIKPQTILEPSFGSGEFLLDARRLYPDATVTGVEKNKTLFDSLKQSNLFCADFMKWKGEPVDLIIGNPPYFVIKEKNPLCMTGRPNIFVAFLYKCLTEHLKEDGFLAFILPTSLMNCSYYQPMR
jgi:type I restriction-modification system DNA methylase subunit